MERVRQVRKVKINGWLACTTAFAIVAIPMKASWGGGNTSKQLIQESYSATENGENTQPYAESRFGYAPAKGTSQSLAHRAEAAEEAEQNRPRGGWSSFDGDRGNAYSEGTRSPASASGEVQSHATTARAHVKFSESEDSLAKRRNGVQEVALIAGELGFFPKTVTVTRDIPVRLFVTGASKSSLCLMMDSFQVRKQVRSNRIEEITFTPNRPGQYRFYCPVNGMEGTLVVNDYAGTGIAN